MDNINTDFFSFESDTEINTEIEYVANKSKLNTPYKQSDNKLLIKVRSNNIQFIFTKVKHLYNYIKNNCIKENTYYSFLLIKDNFKLTILMKSPKSILNYILTYHVDYQLFE